MNKLTNSPIKAASALMIRGIPLIWTLYIVGCASGSDGRLPSTSGYDDPLRGAQHAYNVDRYFRSSQTINP